MDYLGSKAILLAELGETGQLGRVARPRANLVDLQRQADALFQRIIEARVKGDRGTYDSLKQQLFEVEKAIHSAGGTWTEPEPLTPPQIKPVQDKHTLQKTKT